MMHTKKITLWGIMGALALAVSFLENCFELPFLPPGAKPGLANIITMASAACWGWGGALYITIIKSLFALFSRGATAFLLSAAGGLLSAAVIVLCLKAGRCPFSYIGIGILGALTHNAAQLAAACLLTGTPALLYYAPVLILCAVLFGNVTGIVLKILLPVLQRALQKDNSAKVKNHTIGDRN